MLNTMKTLLALSVFALSTGCVKRYDVVMAPEQVDTHDYVVVQTTKSGSIKLWDCRSEPDRAAWDPTCVRVRMQNSARDEAE